MVPSYDQSQEANSTTTASPGSVSETPVSPANASLSTGNDTTVKYNNSTFIYCFLEAQNWVGVDTSAPDCVADPNNTLCTDPDAANRLVGLRFALFAYRTYTENHSQGQSVQRHNGKSRLLWILT